MKRLLIFVAQWLIDIIPNRLIAEPERFFLAFIFIVVGFDAIVFNAPGSVFDEHPDARLINLEVGLCFLFGGLFKILGLWRLRIWLQRLGAAFIVSGCIGFIIGVVLYVPEGGGPIVLVYILLGFTYILRLLQSTAIRWKLHKRGRGDNG